MATSAIEVPAISAWPNLDSVSPVSFRKWQQDGERRRGQNDGDQKRRFDDACHPQHVGGHDRERERGGEAKQRHSEHRTSQLLEVDLDTREQQQVADADQWISISTEGARSHGANPSSNGAANTTAEMIARLSRLTASMQGSHAWSAVVTSLGRCCSSHVVGVGSP